MGTFSSRPASFCPFFEAQILATLVVDSEIGSSKGVLKKSNHKECQPGDSPKVARQLLLDLPWSEKSRGQTLRRIDVARSGEFSHPFPGGSVVWGIEADKMKRWDTLQKPNRISLCSQLRRSGGEPKGSTMLSTARMHWPPFRQSPYHTSFMPVTGNPQTWSLFSSDRWECPAKILIIPFWLPAERPLPMLGLVWSVDPTGHLQTRVYVFVGHANVACSSGVAWWRGQSPFRLAGDAPRERQRSWSEWERGLRLHAFQTQGEMAPQTDSRQATGGLRSSPPSASGPNREGGTEKDETAPNCNFESRMMMITLIQLEGIIAVIAGWLCDEE